MTKHVCSAFRRGGILIALLGLLLSTGRSVFAARAVDVEWVVIQGTACVNANHDAICAPDELAVPKVIVRSDGTVLATTDATGRFSVRVVAQSVIEFELPAGYESATGELSTQVFESGRLDVPLTQRGVASAPVISPTATSLKPTTTATRQNTPTPTLTPIPEPSATQIPPTQAPATKTPAPTAPTAPTAPLPTTEASGVSQALATATTLATATQAATATALLQPTETVTPSAAIVLGNSLTAAPPTAQPAVSATPVHSLPSALPSLPSFEEEAQTTPRFSLGEIPRAYLVSAGVLLGLGLLIGLFAYRSNALKTNSFATSSSVGSYPVGSQAMVWEQGAAQQTPHLLSGREWQPIARRLLSQAHLKSISIDAEAGILAASTLPAPVFVLGGVDGYRLVFTIDPSLPVRSGLIADRSQVSRTAKLGGASRGDAHNLWKYVAQARNLANPIYPTWADWYLIVFQRTDRP